MTTKQPIDIRFVVSPRFKGEVLPIIDREWPREKLTSTIVREAKQRLALLKAAHEGREILCNACGCRNWAAKLYIGHMYFLGTTLTAIFHEGNRSALMYLTGWRWEWNYPLWRNASDIYNNIEIL